VADPTLDVYESRADEWERRRGPTGDAVDFAARLGADERPVVDLGCGPGWDLPALGVPAVAVDAVEPFLTKVPTYAPGAWPVRADLRALPFRRGSLGAAWASKSYVHLARPEIPLALWDLHRSLRVGAPVRMSFFGGDQEHDTLPGDDFAGRRYSLWTPARLAWVVEGAGFSGITIAERAGKDGVTLIVEARRERTLGDTVDGSMRLLVVGINPSWYAADAGVGFARPGNRFWPAALAAGVVTRSRDPLHALRHDHVGMTDLVKRPSARADELSRDDHRAGLDRLRGVVELLAPRAVCIVGLSGWRAAVDRRAVAGVQAEGFGGRPVYLMPNTSGLNARVPPDELAAHFRAAAELADRSSR
jgi:TDG/mug DNA glycosylase family protein